MQNTMTNSCPTVTERNFLYDETYYENSGVKLCGQVTHDLAIGILSMFMALWHCIHLVVLMVELNQSCTICILVVVPEISSICFLWLTGILMFCFECVMITKSEAACYVCLCTALEVANVGMEASMVAHLNKLKWTFVGKRVPLEYSYAHILVLACSTSANFYIVVDLMRKRDFDRIDHETVAKDRWKNFPYHPNIQHYTHHPIRHLSPVSTREEQYFEVSDRDNLTRLEASVGESSVDDASETANISAASVA